MDAQSGSDHRALHEHLAERRQQLRISQTEAARRAGIKSRMTWWEWEKGRRLPYDYNHAGIEDAMAWEPGSVRAIQEGQMPTPRQESKPAQPAPGSRAWWEDLAEKLPRKDFLEVLEVAKLTFSRNASELPTESDTLMSDQ